MAARLNPRHQEFVKDKIQASQLVNRLQSHALGTLEKPMDDSQIRAATVLLGKVLSDAPKGVELTGKDGADLLQGVRVAFNDG